MWKELFKTKNNDRGKEKVREALEGFKLVSADHLGGKLYELGYGMRLVVHTRYNNSIVVYALVN